MTPDEDPGWPRGLSILTLMIPGMIQRQVRGGMSDGLLQLRYVILSFSFAPAMFGIVLPVLQLRGDSLLPWLPLLVAIAVVSIGAGRVAEKPLDCGSDTTLAGSYRTRFFLRIAFAESIALFAFVAVFTGAPLWMYYAAAAVALFRFWTTAAPTRTALARDQAALNASGCSRSLIAALRGPATPNAME